MRGLSSFRKSAEAAETGRAPLAHTLSPPLTTLFAPRHPTVTRRVIMPEALVAAVLSRRRWPQVGPAVIALHAVGVVDFVGRGSSGHVDKCETVGAVLAAVDLDLDVAITVERPSA